MAGRRWTEDEVKLGLFLYFQLPFGKLDQNTPEIRSLAKKLDRTPSSIAMKLCNFASLDPKITDSGRKGLDGASKLDREIFLTFQNDWTESFQEAEKLWAENSVDDGNQSSFKESPAKGFKHFEGATTVERTIEQRVGQNFFRRAVLANYDEACCITGISDVRLLNASHIRPWNVDVKNRHNPSNGLALSATFDRAFDRGLLTITDTGRVKISNVLIKSDNPKMRQYFSPYSGKEICSASRFNPEPHFLRWHNTERFIDAL